MNFENKVAVVTGAGGGLGLTVIEKIFAAKNAKKNGSDEEKPL